MAARNYSSTARRATLTTGVNSSATGFAVSTTTGWPAAPFTLIVDRGLATEEVVTATGLAGLNVTVARGQDGTSAVAHSAGATLEHGISARDVAEPNAHANASSGVHGATGSVVGTTDTQTLDNKLFQSAGGSSTPLTVKAHASQSSQKILDVQNAGGTSVFYVRADGTVYPAAGGGGGSGAPTGTAGGDLSGSYPNPVVDGLQSTPVAATLPASGQVLTYNGSSWAPATPSVPTNLSVSTVTASGQVAGGSIYTSGTATAGAVSTGPLSAGTIAASGSVSGASLSSSSTVSSAGRMTHRSGQEIPRMAIGAVTINVSAASFGSASATFPAGRFTIEPMVFCTLQNAPTGSGKLVARATNATTTGCTIQVYAADGTAVTASGVLVAWWAVQASDSFSVD